MEEHFINNVDWYDTSLFEKYKARLVRGKALGCSNIEEMRQRYLKKIDPLYNSIKQNGILLPEPNKPHIDFIYVYIGRKGEILTGSGGNHRLSIAKLLEIEHIPVLVRIRHKKWQELRDYIAGFDKNQLSYKIENNILAHPDLQDIIN